jgi:hypothetical protein
MAAKTIQEAIRVAMQIGPLSDFEGRCTGEIRDWLAHRFASYQLQTFRDGGPDAQMKDQVAREIFTFIFPPDGPKAKL